MAQQIEVQNNLTVGALAEKLLIPVTQLIAELMKNGIMATVNEQIDFDTAQIIAGELALDVELVRPPEEPLRPARVKGEPTKDAVARPPVVAVMGHVDHGKTSLLDAIRDADTAKGEAGGITQHISAYQGEHNKRLITFLDTPGHEAFSALREHGAHLTDVAIIVVAADDGVKPQTIEAIRFARKAGVKIIVAINKVDKEGADANKVKQQLADQEVLVEGWGGDTVVVEVSAKAKQGIDQLLDMVLLVADVEELKADAGVPASGLVIEAHMEKGRGPVAIALVEQGTLRKGDFIVVGGTYAKIRNLETTTGKELPEATPSTPVVLTGLHNLPDFGDEFAAAKTEKEAKIQAGITQKDRKDSATRNNLSGSDLISIINRSNKLTELNLIVKADVQGSLTSVVDSLKSLNNEEVAVRIIHSGVGTINESDIHLAHTSSAIIYAFNVTVPPAIKRLASRDKVSIRHYRIIYELLDDAKVELTKLLAPEVKEQELGRLLVKGIFKLTKTEVICGGEVTKGKLAVPSQARVMRDKEELAEVEIISLKKGPTEVKEVPEGEMCGLSFRSANRVDLQEGDRLEVFTREAVTRIL